MRRVGKKQLLVGLLSATMVVGSAMPAFAAEWKKDDIGWWYEEDNGQYPTATWRFINNNWFYFQHSGYASTGWIFESGRWYFADSDCYMLTGWVNVDGKNYYLNPISDGTKGAMLTGNVEIDGVTYTFDESGACTTTAPAGITAYRADGTRVTGSGPNGGSTTSSTGTIVAGGSSSGGSSSGCCSSGGCCSSVSNTTSTLQTETFKNLAEEIVAAKEEGTVGSDQQIVDIKQTGTIITVTLTDDETKLDTVDDANVILSTAEAVVEGTSATQVNVQGKGFMSVEDAKAELEAQLANRTLASLSEKYTIVLRDANGNTASYTINIK
ncbi:MAG: hypothetical protein Q4E24_16380 [bacterium]|nr:hypothetical protein [bacterium]